MKIIREEESTKKNITTFFDIENKTSTNHEAPHDGKPAVVGSACDGFTSFDVFRHTSDEVEFRVKCKQCGMTAMDVENSCITCDCDWFQRMFNDFDEDVVD